MAVLQLVGVLTEVNPCEVYVDGDALPGYDVTLNQPGVAESLKDSKWGYFPPRLRITRHRLGGYEPAIGDKVVAEVSTKVNVKDDKTYVNFNGRALALAK